MDHRGTPTPAWKCAALAPSGEFYGCLACLIGTLSVRIGNMSVRMALLVLAVSPAAGERDWHTSCGNVPFLSEEYCTSPNGNCRASTPEEACTCSGENVALVTSPDEVSDAGTGEGSGAETVQRQSRLSARCPPIPPPPIPQPAAIVRRRARPTTGAAPPRPRLRVMLLTEARLGRVAAPTARKTSRIAARSTARARTTPVVQTAGLAQTLSVALARAARHR